MNYSKHLRKGYVDIFKNILKEICEFGIKDGCVLTVTFSTDNPHVVIAERIKRPQEMKIYLTEGMFDDLKVFDTFFEVILYFDGKEEQMKVPYLVVKKIEDVDNNFELDFTTPEDSDFYITDENIINIDFEKKK